MEEFDTLVANLTQRGFRDAISIPAMSSPVVRKVGSNAHAEANAALLAQRGLQRTPKVRDAEIDLRHDYESKNGATDWNNLQVRIDALLSIGYDIFSGGKVALPDNEPAVTLNDIDDTVLDELDPEDLG